MFEPDILTIGELAARWQQTPQQIVDHAQALRVPLYFPFEGLVFDVGDNWHRSTGDHNQTREIEALSANIAGGEARIQRSARGEVSQWEHALSSDECQNLRAEIEAKKSERTALIELLEQRHIERNRCEYRGYLRAAPSTLWDIATTGVALFPHKAFHPHSPIHIATLPDRSGQFWDGRMVALEPGPGCDQYKKNTLTIDDLHAFMAEVKAIEAHQTKQQTAPAVDAAPGGTGRGAMKNAKDYERDDGNGVITTTSLAALLTPEKLNPFTALIVRGVLEKATDSEFMEAFDGAEKNEVRDYLDAYELCNMPYWGAEELASAIHAADSGRSEKLALRAVTLAQKANELPDSFTPKKGVEWAMDRGYLFGKHARFTGASVGTYGHPHNPLSNGLHQQPVAPAPPVADTAPKLQAAPVVGEQAGGDAKPWLRHDERDPSPMLPWYTPARYFARALAVEQPTLLAKRKLLAEKVSTTLFTAGITKRGGVKKFDGATVLKAFVNVNLG